MASIFFAYLEVEGNGTPWVAAAAEDQVADKYAEDGEAAEVVMEDGP